MSENKAQELRAILDEVMPEVVVRDKNNNPLVPPGPYKNTLRLEQQVYRPILHTNAYKPEIINEPLREKLLGFVRRELGEYLHEGRIQPPVLPTGIHMVGGLPIDALLTHLLKIAIAWGTARAVDAFIEAVENSSCPFQEMSVIEGIRVSKETKIYEGVRLVPLPERPERLPHYLPRCIDESIPLGHFKGATILIVDCLVSPHFARPDQEHMELPPPFGFKTSVDSSEAPRFASSSFCAAMSLVCQTRIRQTIQWYHMASDELANVEGIQWVSL